MHYPIPSPPAMISLLPAPATLPVGTYIDDPSVLAHPRPPLMKRMCCARLGNGESCGMVLGWVVCIRAMNGLISHGMCEACVERSLEGLAVTLGNVRKGGGQ